MDNPLIPQEMGKGPKILLVCTIGGAVITVVLAVILAILDLGITPFESGWIAVSAALGLMLFLTLISYKRSRDPDAEEPLDWRVLILQFFGIVLFACAMYGVIYPPTQTPSYTLGGTIEGVKGSGGMIELGAPHKETIPISGEQCHNFIFKTTFLEGTSVTIKFKSQPSSSHCTAHPSHVTMNQDANSVKVACIESFRLSGDIQGLEGDAKIGLEINGGKGEVLPVPVNPGDKNWAFTQQAPRGSSWQVTVVEKPTEQKCQIENGSGKDIQAPVTNIRLHCSK